MCFANELCLLLLLLVVPKNISVQEREYLFQARFTCLLCFFASHHHYNDKRSGATAFAVILRSWFLTPAYLSTHVCLFHIISVERKMSQGRVLIYGGIFLHRGLFIYFGLFRQRSIGSCRLGTFQKEWLCKIFFTVKYKSFYLVDPER